MEKARKKAEEKALKDAEKAAAEPAVKVEKQEAVKPAEITDPREYFNSRVQMIADLRAAGINPFPHKFNVSISIPDFLKKYDYIESANVLEDVTESLAGLIEF